jgi:uncharacterized protein YndB with AHSA1/START domain
MPVTDVRHDPDNLTLTITAEFAAPVERIWQVYADPRQLEKVWGRRATRRRSSTTTCGPAAA